MKYDETKNKDGGYSIEMWWEDDTASSELPKNLDRVVRVEAGEFRSSGRDKNRVVYLKKKHV